MGRITEEEILREQKKLEEEREELTHWAKELEERQEEELWELQRQYHVLEEMRGQISPNDRKFLTLIDENQSRMDSLRIHQMEIRDGIKEALRKKNKEWNMREEDLAEQRRRLERTEEDEE